MNARITKNELIAINSALAAENASLRTLVSALKTQVSAHINMAQSTAARREPASKGVASGAKRPLASFFYLKDAGLYITELKQRGCKVALTARRDDRGHFVVIAG